MPLYEYYDISDPALLSCYDNFWHGQTFASPVAHTVTSVILRMYRVGSPGTITVSVKATSGSHPTGDDLVDGTTEGDTLPEAYSGEWREIALTGAGGALLADTTYAIVVRALDGDANNYVRWRRDDRAPYPRGAHEFSSDGGVTWETDAERDMMFEEWGEP